TADHAVGQAKLDEAVFEFTHLERSAHQDGDLVQRLVLAALARLALQLLDLLANGAGLFLAVPGAGDLHLLAQHIFRAQRLAETAFLVADQERGGREDVAGRAVVPLETDHLGAGEVVIEAQDVVDFGPTPAVDRLVVVADATDVLGLSLFRARWNRECGFRRRSRAAGLRDNGCRRRSTGRLRQQLQPQILRDV